MERLKEITSGKPVVDMEIPIDKIDRSATALVRERINDEVVAEYALAEALPPIQVFRGDGEFHAGDGGHRISAHIRNGLKKIKARVIDCGSAAVAREAARLCAFAANETHGLRRTIADKRKAVNSAFAVPNYASLSDREIASMCRVSHQLVGDIRAELTKRGKLTGAGASKRQTAKEEPEQRFTAPSGRTTTEGPDAEPTTTVTPDSVVPQPVAEPEPDEELRDGLGRLVPVALQPTFRLAKAFVTDFNRELNSTYQDLVTAAEEAWGSGLFSIYPTVKQDLSKVKSDVAASIPFCVCPNIDHPNHATECKLCIQKRGWLTRHNFHQQDKLTQDKIKAKAEEQQ